MPSGEPTKAPLVVLAGMFFIGIVSVTVVMVDHCARKEPYLDSKRIRKVHKVRKRDAAVKDATLEDEPASVEAADALDAGLEDAASPDASSD